MPQWTAGYFDDCQTALCAWFLPCCLSGDVMEELGYDYCTNCWFAHPMWLHERVGDAVGFAKGEEARGFFHGSCGGVTWFLIRAGMGVPYVNSLFALAAGVISCLNFSQAASEAKKNATRVPAPPAPTPETGNPFVTGYCDCCADGALTCLMAWFGCGSCLLADAYARADGVDCLWAWFWLLPAPAMREWVRHKKNIAPGPCCENTPCCADCLPFLLPCGIIQTTIALRTANESGQACSFGPKDKLGTDYTAVAKEV